MIKHKHKGRPRGDDCLNWKEKTQKNTKPKQKQKEMQANTRTTKNKRVSVPQGDGPLVGKKTQTEALTNVHEHKKRDANRGSCHDKRNQIIIVTIFT